MGRWSSASQKPGSRDVSATVRGPGGHVEVIVGPVVGVRTYAVPEAQAHQIVLWPNRRPFAWFLFGASDMQMGGRGFRAPT